MQTLEDRLARIREGAVNRFSPEVLAIMHRATQELVGSGQHERARGPGDPAPEFSLPTSQGETVSLGRLLEHGPTVLTFFRGHW